MSTVFITGANKGIGLELCRAYGESGHSILACCRQPSSAGDLASLAEDIDLTIIGVEIGVDASVQNMAGQLEGRTVDILINNAGTMGPKPEEQTAFNMDFDGWAETMNINVLAPVRVLHALMPNLRTSPDAKAVTITSQLGAISLDMAMGFAYSASKAAINKYMRLAAIELIKENICVGLIHPGWVRTSMGGQGADISPEESASGIKQVIDHLDKDNNGGFWNWNGEKHSW
ncbi:MAG: NAD(P)-dependent dehydrogenase (short-subunit alcohol dehydrogenase family) [Flavobacterium sp.]|jgi:NAD(P)-dependent dehydrogenase (short-subunit alcohol dehydrogenase family)